MEDFLGGAGSQEDVVATCIGIALKMEIQLTGRIAAQDLRAGFSVDTTAVNGVNDDFTRADARPGDLNPGIGVWAHVNPLIMAFEVFGEAESLLNLDPRGTAREGRDLKPEAPAHAGIKDGDRVRFLGGWGCFGGCGFGLRAQFERSRF